MNEDDTNQNVDNTDELNDENFEDLFYQREAKVEEVEEVKEDQEVGDPEEDDNPLASEEDESEEAEEEEDEKPEPKAKNRKSAQERINELTAKAREAERREQALLKRLEEIEAAVKPEKVEEAPKALREQLPIDAPNPDAMDKDGKPIYELGEFDPKYISDLTRFTIEQEMKAAKEKSVREAQEAQMKAAQEELANSWTEKLDKYEEEVPEVRENIRDLVDTFESIEPAYGEYLASTIMMSEIGPQILDYLSQNIGEAQRIVASGPAAATLALGRLEAMLTPSTKEETKRNKMRVSEAKEPPEGQTRGHGGKFAVAPDTDNQEAFEKEFFKKR